MPRKASLTAAAQFRIDAGGENLLDDTRMALLERIAETGSITRAGKAVGISYRTAWLAVDQLNGLSERPLVERAAGGKSGGGTRLTPHGESLLKMYATLREEHGKYLDRLRSGIRDFDRFLRLTRKFALKTSARNQLFGTVESIRKHALSATVVLRLKAGERIVSRITLEGLEGLGLKRGDEAFALIKANWIGLDPDRPGKPGKRMLSDKAEAATRKGSDGGDANLLKGRIVSLKRGDGSSEALLCLKGGTGLVAVAPMLPIRNPKLEVGKHAWARFLASNVILGVAR
jgi:molybdate transport system regulatory protein